MPRADTHTTQGTHQIKTSGKEPKKGGFEISLATDSNRFVVKFLPP